MQTVSALGSFFLAMVLNPDVQRKAQRELDQVVGPHRLPDFADQPSLPYVDAIVKETLRWHPVLPLGIPHRTVADDELEGYFVPKGTVVLCNVWCVAVSWSMLLGVRAQRSAAGLRRACMRDPTAYEDPEEFRPERFIRDGKLDPSVRDPSAFVFGFGRRYVRLRSVSPECNHWQRARG